MEINHKLNYWDVHAGDQLVHPFSALYAADTSKQKKKSSDMMWALLMLTDPSKANPLSRMTRDERLDELSSFIRLEDILEYEEAFVEFKLSYLKKRYRFYQAMLEAREKYMQTLTYEANASQLDNMLVQTKKIWDEFLKIKKELDVEDLEYHTKGSREESATEKGLI